MTRFTISLEEGVDTVIWALNNNTTGDIVVPNPVLINWLIYQSSMWI